MKGDEFPQPRILSILQCWEYEGLGIEVQQLNDYHL